MKTSFNHIQWKGDHLLLLDQRKLPEVEEYFKCLTLQDVCFAIENMVVRGAPAIGIVAAYGVALTIATEDFSSPTQIKEKVLFACDRLALTRPTAVNLFWALQRMKLSVQKESYLSVHDLKSSIINEAIAIEEEDKKMNLEIGSLSIFLLKGHLSVLTHCNAGALATGGFGTALGVIRYAYDEGRIKTVFVCETRPLLQGARLTAWELNKDNIPVTVITDSMAATFMRKKEINAVIVGADRITKNGDVINKIGTYSLAVLAKHHGIPFYVAAPSSTLDLKTSSGDQVCIEERKREEIEFFNGKRVTPSGVSIRNPAFDVTGAAYISAIILDTGVYYSPFSFES